MEPIFLKPKTGISFVGLVVCVALLNVVSPVAVQLLNITEKTLIGSQTKHNPKFRSNPSNLNLQGFYLRRGQLWCGVQKHGTGWEHDSRCRQRFKNAMLHINIPLAAILLSSRKRKAMIRSNLSTRSRFIRVGSTNSAKARAHQADKSL